MLRLSFLALFLLSLALPAAPTRAQEPDRAPASAADLSAPAPPVSSPAHTSAETLLVEDFPAPTPKPATPELAPMPAPPVAPAPPLALPSRAAVLAPPDACVTADRVTADRATADRVGAEPISARRADAYSVELEHIDGRLADLRAARPSIAGPITFIALGGGVALGSFELLVWGHLATDSRFDPGRDAVDRTLLVGMIGGLATSVCGLVWLIDRLHDRQAFAPEVRALKQRRRQLRDALQVSLRADRQQQVLYLQAGF